ncbi:MULTISPECIES: GNAT family N-acetyltransferase [Streptomyces]|uniref:GNAT family N-acetyltransferase n=1 Tax=Streptomyces chilikensis TaxID=1194079 RepID=A0ABV3EWL9_9ACTN|nr:MULTISPECIES: GNAT family N-acetyltransferase [Streptomyces]MDH6226267.1 GNAT superfamily N-acetyltransferase [Streptomyces sp. MJP52]
MDDRQRPVIRVIRAGEWREMKALRLLSLQDPVAHLAFAETYENAASKPDAFWQERTAGAAEGGVAVRQFVAEAPGGGGWAGTVSVLLETPGESDFLGVPIERRQAQVVGVFVKPEYRGTGLIGELLEAAVAWAWERGAEQVRLYVHERNGRAVGAYRRHGFRPSGLKVADGDEYELELVLSKA